MLLGMSPDNLLNDKSNPVRDEPEVPILDGKFPVKRFDDKFRTTNDSWFHNVDGMAEVNLFESKNNHESVPISPKHDGISPKSRLLLKYNSPKFLKRQSSCGIPPCNRLFSRYNWPMF